MATQDSIIDEVDDENNYSRAKIQSLLNLNEESVNFENDDHAQDNAKNYNQSITLNTPIASEAIDTLSRTSDLKNRVIKNQTLEAIS